MLSPEISVIMPVHNGEKYLHGAVHSILNQSFSNFEFIIVDDGSTDHSSRIIHSFDDRRIRLISNGKKLGLTASLNKAMVCAKGKFIARMDSDDVSMPERLECQKNFMMQHPEIGVLGTGYQLIDPDGVPGMKKRFPSSSAVIKWRLCFENPIIHSTVMMRRDALAHAGGYNPKMITAQDYDLWQRMSVFTRLYNLQDILIQFRQHNQSITRKNRREQVKNSILISQKMISSILKCRVPLALAARIWEPPCSDFNDVLQMAGLQHRICLAVIRDPAWREGDKRMVRQEAALKLYGWFRHKVRDPRAWRFLFWALSLHSGLLLALARNRISRNG